MYGADLVSVVLTRTLIRICVHSGACARNGPDANRGASYSANSVDNWEVVSLIS